LPFEDEQETVNVTRKGSHDFRETMVEPNIWEAFRAIGFEFEFDTEAEPYRLLFNEEKLRPVKFFKSCGRSSSPGSTVESEAECQIWLDQQARIK
jgi:hypothetical protein